MIACDVPLCGGRAYVRVTVHRHDDAVQDQVIDLCASDAERFALQRDARWIIRGTERPTAVDA